MDKRVETLLSLWDELKAVESYLRYLRDKFDLIHDQVIQSKIALPRQIENHKLRLKLTKTAAIAVGDAKLVNEILDYIDNNFAGVVKRSVHKYTLANIIDMGIFDTEKGKEYLQHIKQETKPSIRIEYISTAEGAEQEERILQEKGMVEV